MTRQPRRQSVTGCAALRVMLNPKIRMSVLQQLAQPRLTGAMVILDAPAVALGTQPVNLRLGLHLAVEIAARRRLGLHFRLHLTGKATLDQRPANRVPNLALHPVRLVFDSHVSPRRKEARPKPGAPKCPLRTRRRSS